MSSTVLFFCVHFLSLCPSIVSLPAPQNVFLMSFRFLCRENAYVLCTIYAAQEDTLVVETNHKNLRDAHLIITLYCCPVQALEKEPKTSLSRPTPVSKDTPAAVGNVSNLKALNSKSKD